jgi:hypothetical protein
MGSLKRQAMLIMAIRMETQNIGFHQLGFKGQTDFIIVQSKNQFQCQGGVMR